MPNIVIVGFGYEDLITKRAGINKIMHGLKKTDAIVTIVAAQVHWCNTSKLAPYIIVRDTNREECLMIAKLINEQLTVDVECEVLAEFFPAVSHFEISSIAESP